MTVFGRIRVGKRIPVDVDLGLCWLGDEVAPGVNIKANNRFTLGVSVGF